MKVWTLRKPLLMKFGKCAYNVSIIGGADGPTSVFLAGKFDGAFACAVAAGVILLVLLAGLFIFWRLRHK